MPAFAVVLGELLGRLGVGTVMLGRSFGVVLGVLSVTGGTVMLPVGWPPLESVVLATLIGVVTVDSVEDTGGALLTMVVTALPLESVLTTVLALAVPEDEGEGEADSVPEAETVAELVCVAEMTIVEPERVEICEGVTLERMTTVEDAAELGGSEVSVRVVDTEGVVFATLDTGAKQTALKKLVPAAASLASHEDWRQLVNALRNVELAQTQLISRPEQPESAPALVTQPFTHVGTALVSTGFAAARVTAQPRRATNNDDLLNILSCFRFKIQRSDGIWRLCEFEYSCGSESKA